MKPSTRSIQAPAAIVMVRPHKFSSNIETAQDNAFQSSVTPEDHSTIARAAYDEVTAAVDRIRAEGVHIHLFEDFGALDTPDSVFPNNWFSTHQGGHVAVYPMFSPSRRRERRIDIIEMLKAEYRVQDVIDYSGLERDGLFLEGTGAMVFDHLARVAYTARSNRADPVALERFSTHFNFEPIVFDTADQMGRPIYHTNVLMCIATEFCLIGLDTITDPKRAEEVRIRLEESGKEIIELTHVQIAEFAGNAIELSGSDGRILVLSSRAYACLTEGQREIIERTAKIVALDVPTIEMAGGSVRCMIAGLHLAPRQHIYNRNGC